MPERDYFPADYFETNPLEDLTPLEQYETLQWGNEWQAIYEVNAPEPVVTLGMVAQIKLKCGAKAKWSEEDAPFLAIGSESNNIYIVPRRNDGSPLDIPSTGYDYLDLVTQIDYYSEKGGESAYYFHKHEKPYPSLAVHLKSGVAAILPQISPDGRRSYAVAKEGIVG